MEKVLQDLRYGLRVFSKRPAFTLIAILTLTLGIGANTAIFSVVNTILFQPLPYKQPDQLVQVYWQWNKSTTPNVTTTQFVFWRENSSSFEDSAAYASAGAGFNLSTGGDPQRVKGIKVSESFFRVLGVQPILGRSFTSEEDRQGQPGVAILTDNLWRNYFGANPTAVGQKIELNGQLYSVVGVMPAEFYFETPIDILIPLQLQSNPDDQGHNTGMIARLKQDISVEQAQAEMVQLLPSFRNSYPKHIKNTEKGIKLVPYHHHLVSDIKSSLLLLFGAVGLVLLISCANVASLLLSHANARNGEMAVRVALGASRWRLVQQLMTENVLLALIGAVAAIVLALWVIPTLLSFTPEGLPRLSEVHLNFQSIIFTLLISLVISLLFGITPALRTTQINVNEALRTASGRASVNRSKVNIGNIIVITEIGLSVVLLIGSVLLIRTLFNLQNVDMGFDPRNLMTMQVSLNSEKYKRTLQTWNLQQQVNERISKIPGVVAVATVPSLPIEAGLNNYVEIEKGAEKEGFSVEERDISPDYFRVMGIKLLSGRLFTLADKENSLPVVIINQALSQHFWQGRDPVGEQIVHNDQKKQVIGVVSDIREGLLGSPVLPTIYIPMPQVPDQINEAINSWFLTSWIVKTDRPIDLSANLRSVLKESDSQLPIAKLRSMNQVVSSSLAVQKFITTLMSLFAGLALTLTAIGLYGVLSYQVSQRTHEIGIRVALGAQTKDVLKMVILQGFKLNCIGIVIGLATALTLVQLLESLLFGVTKTDPVTFVLVAIILTFVTILACYIPARRATKVDPIIAFKSE